MFAVKWVRVEHCDKQNGCWKSGCSFDNPLPSMGQLIVVYLLGGVKALTQFGAMLQFNVQIKLATQNFTSLHNLNW